MAASSTHAHQPGWTWLIAGIVSVLGGVICLLNPIAATLTAEQIAGWVFLLVGVLQGVDVVRARDWWGRIWAILLAVVFVLVALTLLAQPLRGVLTLTVLVAILLLFGGAMKIGMSWRLRWSLPFWALLLSGILSLVFGIAILANFPWSAAVVLGVLLGVELVSSGAALIIAWQAARHSNPQPA